MAETEPMTMAERRKYLHKMRIHYWQAKDKRPKGRYAQRQAIPIRQIRWNENVPEHLEIDLVHHCGTSLSGQYMHTLQASNVATGWSECVAILGRFSLVIQDGFQRIEQRLPFPSAPT